MKKLFILSFIVSLFFVSQTKAQWWVDGGNLIWPYGDVTINKNIVVDGSIYVGTPNEYGLPFSLYRDGDDSAVLLRQSTNNSNGVAFQGHKSRGTFENPLPPNAGDNLTLLGAGGFNGVGWQWNKGLAGFLACTTWDASNMDTKFTVQVTKGTVRTTRFQVDSLGIKVTGQINLTSLDTAPASASATGSLGEIRLDANYIYVCTATDSWVRVALSTW